MPFLVTIIPISWKNNVLVYVTTSGLQSAYEFINQLQTTQYIPNLPSTVPFGDTRMSTRSSSILLVSAQLFLYGAALRSVKIAKL